MAQQQTAGQRKRKKVVKQSAAYNIAHGQFRVIDVVGCCCCWALADDVVYTCVCIHAFFFIFLFICFPFCATAPVCRDQCTERGGYQLRDFIKSPGRERRGERQ
jgi:hypothetical protein